MVWFFFGFGWGFFLTFEKHLHIVGITFLVLFKLHGKKKKTASVFKKSPGTCYNNPKRKGIPRPQGQQRMYYPTAEIQELLHLTDIKPHDGVTFRKTLYLKIISLITIFLLAVSSILT